MCVCVCVCVSERVDHVTDLLKSCNYLMWRAQAAQAKKEKEVVKKALRKERKTLRAVCKVRWCCIW